MKSSYLYLHGLRFHYLQWNTEDGGQPVVLLNDISSNARIWEPAARLLAQAGFSLSAPDLRGHGLTDKPESGYNFDWFTRALIALLDAWDYERPVLVGHSWGALLALEYASHFTFGPRAPRGLVLIDGGLSQLAAGPGTPEAATWERTAERLAPPYMNGMKLTEFLQYIRQTSHGWEPDEETLPLILSNFEILEEGDSEDSNGASPDSSEVIYPRLSVAHYMELVRALWEYKTYDKFSRVSCPVLMIPARPPGDITPDLAEQIRRKEKGVAEARKRIKDLRVEWMIDTSHHVPLQRPGELARLITEFVQSL
ncbi:MAG: alpha/beta hydrolase [Chloroflexi bacterium]|nr:alpha/beta hydrolase [Chloroflexota bacterium]